MTTIKSLLIALCILCGLPARATVADSNTAFVFAQGQLTAMLQGKQALSYEEAIYQIENAWWGGSLDYVSYQAVLGYHTANIRLLMEEIRTGNKAPVLAPDITETIAQRQARYNNLLANYAIYTYLTQPSLWVHGQKIYYNPAVSYATADPMGTTDWTNTQVSRLLNEGTGNCFALASLYKILADRVGAEAELCTAPGHIYIRHADEHGHLHNVELGGRNFPGTGSIEAVTYTTPNAVKNGIAMRTLSKQQQVALALVYMAKGREYRQGADAGFALACAATALQYDSLNLNAMLLKAEAMEAALLAGGETIEELRGTEQYKEYEQWLGHIYSLGYREMPLQMKNLLVQGWTRDTITKLAEVQYTQAEQSAENTGGDTRYGSSSWGLFNEDIRTQTTERIGRSIYNTTTNTIEGFATDEQLYNHYNFDPVVFAWNMDPVTDIENGPYAVFGNNPVLYVDPEGDLFGIKGLGSTREQRNSARSFARAEGGKVNNLWSKDIHVSYYRQREGNQGAAYFPTEDVVITATKDIQYFTPNGNKYTWGNWDYNNAKIQDEAYGDLDRIKYMEFITMGGKMPYDPAFGPLDYEQYLIPIPPLFKAFNVTKRVATGAQYSVAYETKLARNLYPGKGYYSHFKAANTSLSNTMASDATFANSMSKLGISVPRSSTGSILGKSPANWVWHHDVNAGVLQLVPKVQHTTGSIFWNTMHPGGLGGMAIWGK